MKLFYQTHSPYARKVLVFAHELGLATRIEVIHQETSPTLRNDTVFDANPLGKVPVLVLDDEFTLYDSGVICDYLQTLAPSLLIPAAGEARWRNLRLASLAQGMADAGILLRWEETRRPPGVRWPPMAAGQSAKLLAGYDWLEREQPFAATPDLGQVALATTLAWLEFRELPAFRKDHRRLAAWFDDFSRRPSMTATSYSGQTQDR
jgi:glutathione S-transferase